MKLRFDESQIRYYADKYPEDYDNPLDEIKGEVKRRGHLTQSDLTAVANWAHLHPKYKNAIKAQSDDCVEKATRSALSSDAADFDAICILKDGLDGVGDMMASTILHWFHKDCCPIWSKFPRCSVGIDNSILTPEMWEDYVSCCRCLAKKNKVCMRTLDRALWKYSESGGA